VIVIIASDRLVNTDLRQRGDLMMQAKRDLLELLKFELKFLEDGGYGRSTRTPWLPTRTFQDSPSCLNFDDPSRPHPCRACLLMRFVPEERRKENVPCWFIPLSAKAETIDYYSRCGTQLELEEALGKWLRDEIQKIESEANVQSADREEEEEICRLAET
jgi:hypothetical protein